MKYMLGVGFYGAYHNPVQRELKQRAFALGVLDNMRADPPPDKSVLLICGGEAPRADMSGWPNDTLAFDNNLGAWSDLVGWHGKPPLKTSLLSGFTATMLELALLAYLNESDLIYKEQDVVIHGPWVRQLYADCGDRQCALARSSTRGCLNGLMLFKHAFIPCLVQDYLRFTFEKPEEKTTEAILYEVMQLKPEAFSYLSFGSDCERPVPFDAPVWYMHASTHEELDYVEQRFYTL